MIPYILHVLARYITLLHTWGSVHLTISYLDRFEQLAKFTGSDYWVSRQANLSAIVRVTLQTAIKIPPTRSPTEKTVSEANDNHDDCDEDDNVFLSDYLELERYMLFESQIVAGAAERAIAAAGEDIRDVVYPVFSSSLPPLHLTKLTLLQLELSWSHQPPSQEILVEYYHLLKTSRDNKSCDSMSRDMPQELDKLSSAWLSLLADFQPSVPAKSQKNKPAVRRGRSRRKSGTKTTLRPTTSRTAGGRGAVGRTRKQSVTKKDQSKEKSTVDQPDHIASGKHVDLL